MKVQKTSYFVLALALCMMIGLLPIQAFTPSFVTPAFISIAGASELDGTNPEEIIPIEPIQDENFPEIEVEEMPEYIDDLSEYDEQATEASLEATEEVAGSTDDTVDIGWVPVAIIISVLLISGIGAFYLATRKKK